MNRCAIIKACVALALFWSAFPMALASSFSGLTAPSGDLNKDGLVSNVDTLCLRRVFQALELETPLDGHRCDSDEECGFGSYCREGFSTLRLCMPSCLSESVRVGQRPGDCTDEDADDSQCRGGVLKDSVDLNCDGRITNVDFQFQVGLSLSAQDGGDFDLDSDGILNFCDGDSDGDGDPDSQDCDPFDEASYLGAPEVCDGVDNDCDLLVDKQDPDLSEQSEFCAKQLGVCEGMKKPPALCVAGYWDGCGNSVYHALSADYEDFETRCDGIDNDCDGLIDNDDPGIGVVCCLDGGDCPEGQFCLDDLCQDVTSFSCESESDCPAEFHCDESKGTCSPDISLSGFCVEDSDCASELRCIQGSCGIPGEMGADCVVEWGCAPGLFCDENSMECRSLRGPGESCVEDSDCVGPATCLAGTCGSLGMSDDPCTWSGDCAASLVCDSSDFKCGQKAGDWLCSFSSECPAGQHCSSGVCLSPQTKGGSCSTSADCAPSYHCSLTESVCEKDFVIGSECVGADECPKDVQCVDGLCQPGGGGGSFCVIDLDCAQGFHCDESTEACIPDRGWGSACNQNSDCADHMICMSGVCSDPLLKGADCYGAGDCAAGNWCSQELGICTLSLKPGEACSQAESCVKGSECLEGICTDSGSEACETSTGCSETSFCDAGVCRQKRGPGSSCDESQSCSAELICSDGTCAYSGFREDLCTEVGQCNSGYGCLAGQCIPLEGYGAECMDSSVCGSQYCGNERCCDYGDCCAAFSDCPEVYSQPSACESPQSCQGTARVSVCEGYVCRSDSVEDDSGCGAEVVADECGSYADLKCDGSMEQDEPLCKSSCSSEYDCDPLTVCVGGTCQRLLCVLEGDSGAGVSCSVHISKLSKDSPDPSALALAVSYDPGRVSLGALRLCDVPPDSEEIDCSTKDSAYCSETLGDGYSCLAGPGVCALCAVHEPGAEGLSVASGHRLDTCAQGPDGCPDGVFHFLVSDLDRASITESVYSDAPWSVASLMNLEFSVIQDGVVHVGISPVPGVDLSDAEAELMEGTVKYLPDGAPSRWLSTQGSYEDSDSASTLQPGLEEVTAPSGDINADGLVNTADLQCLLKARHSMETGGDSGFLNCDEDADCPTREKCRAGVVSSKVCMPDCIGDDVAFYLALTSPCPQWGSSSTCRGGAPKKLVDLDCNEEINALDYERMRNILLKQYSLLDHDGDGALNGCDPDSDGDGVHDELDCSPLGVLEKPLLCNTESPSSPDVLVLPAEPVSSDALSVFFQQHSVDPEGDTVGYDYAWYRDNELMEVTGPSVAAELTSHGEIWRVNVVASDGHHSSAPASALVKIGNHLPEIQSLLLHPESPTRDDMLYCDAQITDLDEDDVLVSRYWFVDGLKLEGAEGPALAADTLFPGQEIRCDVLVSDGFGPVVVESSNSVEMFNNVPFIGQASIQPDTLNRLDKPTCVAEPLGDADGDPLDIAVFWEIQGGEIGTSVYGEPWEYGPDFFFRGAEVRCSVYASDGWKDGVVGPVWSDTVVIGNAAPYFTQDPEIYPVGFAGHNDLVTCDPGAFGDPDTDSLQLSLIWEHRPTAGDEPYEEVYTAPVGNPETALPNAYDAVPWLLGVPPEHDLRCRVKVEDFFGDFAIAEAAPVSIKNQPPTASGLEIGPEGATVVQALNCSLGNYSDPDGDSVDIFYSVYADGALIYGPSEDSSFPPGLHARGDQVSCGALVRDFFGAEVEVFSSSIEVGNILPIPPQPTLSPDEADSSTTLECLVPELDTEDADGDPLDYEIHWLKDGLPVLEYQGKTELEPSEMGRCETWSCKLTVSDGVDEKERFSNSVEIAGQYALDFDGSSSFVEVSVESLGDSMLHLPGIVLSMWLRPNNTANKSMVLASKRGQGADELSVRATSTDDLYVSLAPSGIEPVTLEASAIFENPAWRHILIDLNAASGSADLYVDGVQVDGAIFSPAAAISFDSLSPILFGRRCQGFCDDGNPEQAYMGEMDELHFELVPLSSPPEDSGSLYEATVTEDTLLTFSMNEPVGASESGGEPKILVDRGPSARHAIGAGVIASVSHREGCVAPLDYPPSPGNLLKNPADGSFYPGSNVTCSMDDDHPSLDPEGYPVCSQLQWLVGGAHDSAYDGQSEYMPLPNESCEPVQCRLLSEDFFGNETSTLGTFFPRDLADGGKGAPNTEVEALAGIEEALSPMISADAQQAWTLSFWYRFQDSPDGQAELVVGDNPDAVSPDDFASWLNFVPEIQKVFHHSEEGVSHYRYRCGIRMKSTYQLFSTLSSSHDHFLGGVDRVLPSDAIAPCVTGSWYQFVVMRQGLKMWILESSWAEGETQPSPHTVLWEGEDTGNNLVLPYAVDPTLILRGFGEGVWMEELHISLGLRYAQLGTATPLVPDEPGTGTRLLWSMEDLEEDSSMISDHGPFEAHGQKEDADASGSAGITNLCAEQ